MFLGAGFVWVEKDVLISGNAITKQEGDLTIANWNLQIFGDTKEENKDLMVKYATKISKYDIIFVQEIRDSDGSAFQNLCFMLPEFNCEISSKAGRTNSKEQYGIIFRKNITLVGFKDFNPDSQDRWERPPIKTTFDISGYKLNVYNIHTDPDKVKEELSALEKAVFNEGRVIVLGDLNADCSYYNRQKSSEFQNWFWALDDLQDTTVSQSDCAYDRIIFNKEASKDFVKSGIDSQDITKDVSDHYLVWAEIKTK